MIKFRWGLGGLFVLWVIAMALWAAVGLARSARGDTGQEPSTKPQPTASVTPGTGEQIFRTCRREELACGIPIFIEFEEPPVDQSATEPNESSSPAVTSPRWVLALAPPSNPVRGPLTVSLALTSASPASLTLIDVAGRRVAEEALGGLGPGPHRLTPPWRLTAGVYWLVLRQEGTTVHRRLVKL